MWLLYWSSWGINNSCLSFFSPDGKFLVFLSAKSCVDSGAHSATNSLHKIEWNSEGEPSPGKIIDVVSWMLNFFELFICYIFILVVVSHGATCKVTSWWSHGFDSRNLPLCEMQGKSCVQSSLLDLGKAMGPWCKVFYLIWWLISNQLSHIFYFGKPIFILVMQAILLYETYYLRANVTTSTNC